MAEVPVRFLKTINKNYVMRPNGLVSKFQATQKSNIAEKNWDLSLYW